MNKFNIVGNMIGDDTDIGSGQAGYGAFVLAGTSNYYTIMQNICAAQNVTGCVFDGGTGVAKTVANNH